MIARVSMLAAALGGCARAVPERCEPLPWQSELLHPSVVENDQRVAGQRTVVTSDHDSLLTFSSIRQVDAANQPTENELRVVLLDEASQPLSTCGREASSVVPRSSFPFELGWQTARFSGDTEIFGLVSVGMQSLTSPLEQILFRYLTLNGCDYAQSIPLTVYAASSEEQIGIPSVTAFTSDLFLVAWPAFPGPIESAGSSLSGALVMMQTNAPTLVSASPTELLSDGTYREVSLAALGDRRALAVVVEVVDKKHAVRAFAVDDQLRRSTLVTVADPTGGDVATDLFGLDIAVMGDRAWVAWLRADDAGHPGIFARVLDLRDEIVPLGPIVRLSSDLVPTGSVSAAAIEGKGFVATFGARAAAADPVSSRVFYRIVDSAGAPLGARVPGSHDCSSGPVEAFAGDAKAYQSLVHSLEGSVQFIATLDGLKTGPDRSGSSLWGVRVPDDRLFPKAVDP